MKMKYISPQVEIRRVELEEGLATMVSTTTTVDEWGVDPDEPATSDGDIWIPAY
jgi:hypothetical protein